MQIYHLQTQQYKTLLIGDPRPLAEFAAVLGKHNFPFTILSPAALNSFGDIEAFELPKGLLEYSEHIVESYEEASSQGVDVIVDVSATFAGDKAEMLDELAQFYPNALLLSSTLMCTATEISALLSEPRPVIGFNGCPNLISTVSAMEIAPSLRSSEEEVELAKKYFAALGYTPEIIEDRVGLVMPRVLATLINEAAFAVMEKVASPEDIDTAMQLGTNYPKGLLRWADEIGIEIICSILEALYLEYRQERYRTCVLLKQYLRAGWVGVQAGHGFYTYEIPGVLNVQ